MNVSTLYKQAILLMKQLQKNNVEQYDQDYQAIEISACVVEVNIVESIVGNVIKPVSYYVVKNIILIILTVLLLLLVLPDIQKFVVIITLLFLEKVGDILNIANWIIVKNLEILKVVHDNLAEMYNIKIVYN